MALEERTESNSRSLHWAPLRSWNLFSGRVRSRLPHESPSAQLPRSQSTRNYIEGGRGVSATSRASGRVRSSESSRKGGDIARRDLKQRVREEIHRQGGTSVLDEQLAPNPSELTSRRRPLHNDRSLEASEDWSLDRTARPSAHIAHHQQHHHHDHHHHHYHYHHLYHQPPRRSSEHQDQGLRMAPTSGTASSSRSNRRNADQRRYLRNRPTSYTTTPNGASNSRNAVIEARDRLDERLRGAALLSNRHNNNNTALPGGFLEDFNALFDVEDDAWSDDEVWELGVQDWLAAWGYGEGWQADMLSLAEQFPAVTGLSKSAIKNLSKEIFVPRVRRRDKEIEDASLEQDDCSVCLERFLAGQLLIRLPCKHRFHPDCLTPWLESHGQCPYCRAKIGSDATGEASSTAGASASVLSSDDELLAWMGLTVR